MMHKGTRAIETQRLMLRRFQQEDARDMFERWGNDPEVSRYMRWQPMGTLEQAEKLLEHWVNRYESETNYHWAVAQKDDDRVIGSMSMFCVHEEDQLAEIGYCLGQAYWGQGYMTEAVRAMVHYGLFDVGFNRVEAYHSVNNPVSGSVMRKVGMTFEGMARQKYRNADGFQDSNLYGILKGDLFQPGPFSGFYDAALPGDGELSLVCLRERPSDPVTGHVPDYLFEIRAAGEKVGNISLRIGMCDSLYYGGQIGYGVEEAHRGYGYAGRACKLLLPLIRWHGYRQILITNNHTNQASRRVCEKLGASLVRVAELPDWHEIYQAGQRYECIWIWDVAKGEG